MTVKASSPDTAKTQLISKLWSNNMLPISTICYYVLKILKILTSSKQIWHDYIYTNMSILIRIYIIINSANRIIYSNHIGYKGEILSLKGIYNSLCLSSSINCQSVMQGYCIAAWQMNSFACQELLLCIKLKLLQHTRTSLSQSRQCNTSIYEIHTCHHLCQAAT